MTDRARKNWTLAAMCLAIALINIDVLALSVALPSLQGGLDLTDTELQWSMNVFVLALTVFLITGGRLGDIYGRKLIFQIGLIVFVAGSVLSGLAQDFWWLVSARAVQGIGYALVFPLSMALLAATFSKAERPRAMGIWGAAAAIAISVGPLVGGALTEAIDWRAVFFVNVPVGAACFALVAWAVGESRDEEGPKGLDWPGLILLMGGLTGIAIGVTQGSTWGWGSTEIVLLLGLGLIALLAFVAVELRVRTPLIDIRLFRSPKFSGSNGVGFLLVGIYYAFFYNAAIYLQLGQGFSPATTGLALLPFTVAALFASRASGWVTSRLGARTPIAAGSAIMAIALVGLAFVDSDTAYLYLAVAFAILAVGLMFAWSPLGTVVVNSVPAEKVGEASGVNLTFRDAGGVVALALALVVSQAAETSSLDEETVAGGDTLTKGERHEVKGLLAGSASAEASVSSLPPGQQERVNDAAEEAVGAGFQAVMWLTAAFAAGSFVLAVLTLGPPFWRRNDDAERGPPEHSLPHHVVGH